MGLLAPWNSFRTRSTSLLTLQSFPSTANVLLPREERLPQQCPHHLSGPLDTRGAAHSVTTGQMDSWISPRVWSCVPSFSFTRHGVGGQSVMALRIQGTAEQNTTSPKEGSRQRNTIRARVAAVGTLMVNEMTRRSVCLFFPRVGRQRAAEQVGSYLSLEKATWQSPALHMCVRLSVRIQLPGPPVLWPGTEEPGSPSGVNFCQPNSPNPSTL